jgi:hypothetical protein
LFSNDDSPAKIFKPERSFQSCKRFWALAGNCIFPNIIIKYLGRIRVGRGSLFTPPDPTRPVLDPTRPNPPEFTKSAAEYNGIEAYDKKLLTA